MTGSPGRQLRIETPPCCPRCGWPRVCFEYALGEPFGDFHCARDHYHPGACGWSETQFVGIGEHFIVVSPHESDLEEADP